MKNKFGKIKKGKEDVSLQITSMADIFTILLVFLLKSFATDAAKITPHDNLTLPEAAQSQPLVEAMRVEILSNMILVDEKPTAELNQFLFDPKDLESNGTSRSLSTAFIHKARKHSLEKSPRLLVLADQNAPFSTIKRVLASASNGGFEDFKLVVVGDQ